jgi:hypothetical protein
MTQPISSSSQYPYPSFNTTPPYVNHLRQFANLGSYQEFVKNYFRSIKKLHTLASKNKFCTICIAEIQPYQRKCSNPNNPSELVCYTCYTRIYRKALKTLNGKNCPKCNNIGNTWLSNPENIKEKICGICFKRIKLSHSTQKQLSSTQPLASSSIEPDSEPSIKKPKQNSNAGFHFDKFQKNIFPPPLEYNLEYGDSLLPYPVTDL